MAQAVETKREQYDRMSAVYPGDCPEIVGQVVGPTYLREYLTVEETEPTGDGRTRAFFRPTTQPDMVAAGWVAGGQVIPPAHRA